MHLKRRAISQQRVTVIGVGLIAFIAFYAITVNAGPSPVTSTTTTSQTTATSITSTVGSSSTPQDTGKFGTATGIIIPFYLPPSNANFAPFLATILTAKEAFPTVPMIVIINPDSGVGPSKSTVMAGAVQEMQNAGIYVIGYDWTNYGCVGSPPFPAGSTCTTYAGSGGPYVTLTDIENNMTDYTNWYGVQGTFFDGMANIVGFESYYSQLSLYANSLGQQYTIGNPGSDTPATYINSVTSMVVYEGATLPAVLCTTGSTAACLDESWHALYGKYNFALIGFDQPQLAASYVQQASQYVGWVYITDNTGCPGGAPYNVNDPSAPCGAGVPVNPYNTLPSYLTAEMAALASAAG